MVSALLARWLCTTRWSDSMWDDREYHSRLPFLLYQGFRVSSSWIQQQHNKLRVFFNSWTLMTITVWSSRLDSRTDTPVTVVDGSDLTPDPRLRLCCTVSLGIALKGVVPADRRSLDVSRDRQPVSGWVPTASTVRVLDKAHPFARVAA